MYHHVNGLIEDERLAINWISSPDMFADGPTKPLFMGPFKKHQEKQKFIE